MKTDLLCNDIHSKLNATTVAEIVFPRSEGDVIAAIQRAGSEEKSISICGGRHAMGGQQFGEGTILLDMTELDFIRPVDRIEGTVEAGAGIKWPALISALHTQQENEATVWTIRQKQTGADHLTLGGALAANIHGRGLHMKPFIGDVESFRLIGADGIPRDCSRTENADLFGLAIGGKFASFLKQAYQRLVEWLAQTAPQLNLTMGKSPPWLLFDPTQATSPAVT